MLSILVFLFEQDGRNALKHAEVRGRVAIVTLLRSHTLNYVAVQRSARKKLNKWA